MQGKCEAWQYLLTSTRCENEEFLNEKPMRKLPPKLLEEDGGVCLAFGETRREVTTRTSQQFRDPDRDEETARDWLVTHHHSVPTLHQTEV